MDKITKIFVKPFLKERRRHIYKLPQLWWSIALSILSLVLLVASYFTYENHGWISGVLVSASCGCITGLTFYFLANIRNNKMLKVHKEYETLKKTFDILSEIVNYRIYYKIYSKILSFSVVEGRDIFEDGVEILSLIDILEEASNDIPPDVYQNVTKLGYDPLDYDNLRAYRDKINNATTRTEMIKAIEDIYEEILPVIDEIQQLYREREDQIMFMGRYFF